MGYIVEAVKCIYEDTKCCVRKKGELSDFFMNLAGVIQEDVSAPFLFLIVMDYILRNQDILRTKTLSHTVGSHQGLMSSG